MVIHQSRIFAYCRVSTSGQTVDNQLEEIALAGFTIAARRSITETISGGTVALERPGFRQLLAKMEPGDRLVVTKLDRLGRDAGDVRRTIEHLAAEGVSVHCLALGPTDLTSTSGKLIMQVLAAMAEFERDLMLERTMAGLIRAKAAGKQLGRPGTFTAQQKAQIAASIRSGAATVSGVAREHQTSRTTIQRLLRSESGRVS